ncbi:LacI family DNA-binding transcriptional regulator [Shimia biformata]|uniref:LacI family DNA-binding transcriptional regulator n=1 Tax=Shimia biformata TaxID=1294299 RepID=UPI00195057CE|nr:LacI family DNA-binding transcriptional regulator [Shimia biformata]
MKKATIKTISDRSGLSTATVDRVLNNRPGVSASARHKVLSVARDLGYLPEEDSTPMPAQPAQLEFLMPIGTNAFLRELAYQIEDFCDRLPLVASVKLHQLKGLEPEHLEEAAAELSPSTSGVGVVATDHPRTRELLKDLTQTGTRVVTIASDVPSIPRAAYVGVDNVAAGRVAGLLTGRLIGKRPARVGIILGSRRYRGHEEREMGYRSILQEEFPGITVTSSGEVQDGRTESYDLVKSLLAEDPGISGLYCVGGGRSGVAQALKEAGRAQEVVFICHDHTDESRKFLLDGTVDAVIDQNARLIAEQAVIALLGSIATSLPTLMRKFIEPRIIFKENIPTTMQSPSV